MSQLSAIDLHYTALVLIDLQQGIVNLPTLPRSGAEVIQNAVRLLERFREAEAPVVLVRVAFSLDGRDALQPEADSPVKRETLRPEWSELVPEIGPRPYDILITKRHWGAFGGTELDLQLRRRGVSRIVLGGIATNFGVESTARAAYELGYNQIFVEDAMASLSEEAHRFSIREIFPRIGQVRSTQEVLSACTLGETKGLAPRRR
ncbi:MAG: hydrolase [Verrucomicrobia bacterium]|nr:hydrolase [Verrucomicrobiota bacterium]MBV9674664.1 hydrolase [Verrucomicrobiota bacterium]